jgi:hypothetical protein
MEAERKVHDDVIEQLENDITAATARADEIMTQLRDCESLLEDTETRAAAAGEYVRA